MWGLYSKEFGQPFNVGWWNWEAGWLRRVRYASKLFEAYKSYSTLIGDEDFAVWARSHPEAIKIVTEALEVERLSGD